MIDLHDHAGRAPALRLGDRAPVPSDPTTATDAALAAFSEACKAEGLCPSLATMVRAALARERAVRAMKAAGHTIASKADRTVLNDPEDDCA